MYRMFKSFAIVIVAPQTMKNNEIMKFFGRPKIKDLQQ